MPLSPPAVSHTWWWLSNLLFYLEDHVVICQLLTEPSCWQVLGSKCHLLKRAHQMSPYDEHCNFVPYHRHGSGFHIGLGLSIFQPCAQSSAHWEQ
jgi:hypothetical protein